MTTIHGKQRRKTSPKSRTGTSIKTGRFQITNARRFIALGVILLLVVTGGVYARMSQADSPYGRSTITKIAYSQIGHAEWDASVLDYTGNVRDAWCAYFVSWVYKKAGYPMRLDNDGRVPLAWKPGVSVKSLFEAKRKFFPAQKNGGYQAKAGDVVVFGEERSHVAIVLGYYWNSNGFMLRTIEGNTNITNNQGPGSGVDRVVERTYTDSRTVNILGFGQAEAFIPCSQGGYKC
ncbi:CHAP domain-containing protein [bacterium]|nr:CHAP domain-containing protein [bacterium]